MPQLQVLQSQPPPSVAASKPPALALVVGAARTMVLMLLAAAVSTSGDMQLHELPQEQLEPQLHLPLLQDMITDEGEQALAVSAVRPRIRNPLLARPPA